MLGCFKKTRKEIVKIIQKSPITEDGYYVCKQFKELNSSIGEKLDKKYKYSRDYFENKICFNQADIEIYLETNTINYDIEKMKQRDNYIYNIIKDDMKLVNNLNENIPGYPFTLGELIDTSIFIFYCKY